MVGQVVRSLPKINVSQEDHQAEYPLMMVEFEGKIFNRVVTILIDLGASLSYISPKIVKSCHLETITFKSAWLVQLDTGAKRRVPTKIDNRPIVIIDHPITTNLNILPLGSYDIFIGMDWFEIHWSLVNCKAKTISYLSDEGVQHEIQGV